MGFWTARGYAEGEPTDIGGTVENYGQAISSDYGLTGGEPRKGGFYDNTGTWNTTDTSTPYNPSTKPWWAGGDSNYNLDYTNEGGRGGVGGGSTVSSTGGYSSSNSAYKAGSPGQQYVNEVSVAKTPSISTTTTEPSTYTTPTYKTPTYGALPVYGAPTYDEDAIKRKAAKKAAVSRYSLQRAIKSAISKSGGSYDNPHAQAIAMAKALSAGSSGLSNIMATAEDAARKEYDTEYGRAIDTSKTNFAATLGQYQTENQSLLNKANQDFATLLNEWASGRTQTTSTTGGGTTNTSKSYYT